MLKHHVVLDAITKAERLANCADGSSRKLVNCRWSITKARRNKVGNVADWRFDEANDVSFHKLGETNLN